MWLVAAICLTATAHVAAYAQEPLKGIALIIAQSDYQNLRTLSNPPNDARALQKLLVDLGFEVSTASDRDRRRLEREIERFVEDAESADVALLYYSGHGIEAGGNNYLVPIDADIDALDAADTQLVPLQKHLARLQRIVPLTITLLDACRTNPFPPGALLKTESAPEGLAVTPSGLGRPRSVTTLRMGFVPPTKETFGSVIGYSAEPGTEAFDGLPGGNSPYAEALVRHLSAMGGEEFGTVLRMVSEEVYLKTQGKQRPWVNESLRRLVYLGGETEEPEGPATEILRERRRLLVRISELPSPARREIEQISGQDDVPMDTVYAVLASLGVTRPTDPSEIDRVLREQAPIIKEILSQRAVVIAADPEVERLGDLASQAVAEGALQTAIKLHQEIKDRVAALSKRLDDVENDIAERRREFAAAYAASAATNGLVFDFRAAAADYELAFEQVRLRDPVLAWEYRHNQAHALWRQGSTRGDNDALREAIDIYRDALTLVSSAEDRPSWVLSQHNLAVALSDLGGRLGDAGPLREAVAINEAILESTDRSVDPQAWVTAQLALGNSYLTLSERDDDEEVFRKAVLAYRQAGLAVSRTESPEISARISQNIGVAMARLARRIDSRELAVAAAGFFELALEEFTREAYPEEWANTQNSLAAARRLALQLGDETSDINAVIRAYEAALEVRDHDKLPVGWAETWNNLGNAYRQRAARDKNPEDYRAALQAYERALEVRTLENEPVGFGRTHVNRGTALADFAALTDDAALYDEALEAYRIGLQGFTPERRPVDWAETMMSIGLVLDRKGILGQDDRLFAEADAAYQAALTRLDPARSPTSWSNLHYNIGLVNQRRGLLNGAEHNFKVAIRHFDIRLSEDSRAGRPVDANTATQLGHAYSNLADLKPTEANYRGAIEAYRLAFEAHEKVGDVAAAASNKAMAAYRKVSLAIDLRDETLADESVEDISAAIALGQNAGPDFDLATARNELGRGYHIKAELTGDRIAIDRARSLYLEAATDFEESGRHDEWLGAYVDYARTEIDLFMRTEDDRHFAAALDAYRRVANVAPRDGNRLVRARAAVTLAQLLLHGVTARDVGRLDEAAAAYRMGLEGLSDAEADEAAQARLDLGTLLVYRASQDRARIAELPSVIEELRRAASVLTVERNPAAFADAQNGIAVATLLIAERSGDVEGFARAVSIAREALRIQVEAKLDTQIPYTRDSLCRALSGLGSASRDRRPLDEAELECQAAVVAFEASGDGEAAAEAAQNLAKVKQARSSLR